jgi:hypothetical protein
VGVGVDVGAMWLRLTLAVRPVLTSRPAVLKCSEVILTWPNLPSSCGVAGRVKESEETSATLWCSTALAVREGIERARVCARTKTRTEVTIEKKTPKPSTMPLHEGVRSARQQSSHVVRLRGMQAGLGWVWLVGLRWCGARTSRRRAA